MTFLLIYLSAVYPFIIHLRSSRQFAITKTARKVEKCESKISNVSISVYVWSFAKFDNVHLHLYMHLKWFDIQKLGLTSKTYRLVYRYMTIRFDELSKHFQLNII